MQWSTRLTAPRDGAGRSTLHDGVSDGTCARAAASSRAVLSADAARLGVLARVGGVYFTCIRLLFQNRYDDLRGGVRRGAGEMRISETGGTLLESVTTKHLCPTT